MKKRILICIFIGLFSIALFCGFFLKFKAEKTQITLQFTSNSYGGIYAPRHYLAVWITDTNNNYIKTLLSNFGSYPQDLTEWYAQSNQDIDANTGATIYSFSGYSLPWDFTDKDGNQLPYGHYRIWMELTEDESASVAQDSSKKQYLDFFCPSKDSLFIFNSTEAFTNISINYEAQNVFLNNIIIEPDTVFAPINYTYQLSAKGLNQYGEEFPLDGITWNINTSEHILNENGYLIIFEDEGQFEISAQFDTIVGKSVLKVDKSHEPLNRVEKKNKIHLYPNPVHNILNVDYNNIPSQELPYQIHSISGQLFKEGTLHHSIDVSTLPTGTFILTIKEYANYPFIKQ